MSTGDMRISHTVVKHCCNLKGKAPVPLIILSASLYTYNLYLVSHTVIMKQADKQVRRTDALDPSYSTSATRSTYYKLISLFLVQHYSS